MLLVLSPAKSLDFTPAPLDLATTEPAFAADTAALVRAARRLKRRDLQRLMDISPALADLNWRRFREFDLTTDEGTPAAFAFAGDVYVGLDARTLPVDALAWMQGRVRILSGLYGLLRPLDRIQPYRLEMGSRLHTRRGETLYAFWGAKLAKALKAELADDADRTLVNLASQEYFGAVDLKALKAPVISVRFLEAADGEARMISFFAKKARGLMARWAATNGVERAADLRGFDAEGYRLAADRSDETTWTFTRPKPLAQGRGLG